MDVTRPVAFICGDCQRVRLTSQQTFSVGYGRVNGLPICYACCAARDVATMRDTGRIGLYLVGDVQPQGLGRHRPYTDHAHNYRVTNWPNSLTFHPFRVTVAPHGGGFGSHREDAWFVGPDGATWHLVVRGDMDVGTARRLKGRAS
jgi:hypothetical protein